MQEVASVWASSQGCSVPWCMQKQRHSVLINETNIVFKLELWVQKQRCLWFRILRHPDEFPIDVFHLNQLGINYISCCLRV